MRRDRLVEKCKQSNKTKINAKRNSNREKINEYKRNRKANNPLHRLTEIIRTSIYKSFKKGGYTKNSKPSKILACSYEEFKVPIEKQFDEKMSWDNQGSYWHIDHFFPVSSAIDESHLLRLNHYTNLRPLEATANLLKRDNAPFKFENGIIIPFLPDDIHYINRKILSYKSKLKSVDVSNISLWICS